MIDFLLPSTIAKLTQHTIIHGLSVTDFGIAELEGEDVRTIQNDAKQAREDLTAIIFGLDGLVIRFLRE